MKSIHVSYSSDNAPGGRDEDFSLSLGDVPGFFKLRRVELLSSSFWDNTNIIVYDVEGKLFVQFATTATGAGDFKPLTDLQNLYGAALTNFSNAGSGNVSVQYAMVNKITPLDLDLDFNGFPFLRMNVQYVRPVGLALPVLHQWKYEFRFVFEEK